MTQAAFKGFIAGLSLVIFLGPGFFTLLKASLHHGFRHGIAVATGIFLSDVLCVALCLLGLTDFIQDPKYKSFIGLFGIVMLTALGLRYLFKAPPAPAQVKDLPPAYLPTVVKGFLVNLLNPFLLVVWLGILSIATSETDTFRQTLVFMIAALTGVLFTDILKALFAHRIKRLLHPELLRWSYRVIGVILLLFALRMLCILFIKG